MGWRRLQAEHTRAEQAEIERNKRIAENFCMAMRHHGEPQEDIERLDRELQQRRQQVGRRR
jgi:hypothetical protein